MSSLFAELKRRNVFRVALFYIVSAWVVVQVAETVLPLFDVPDGALRAVVVILVLGFPLALVFAWVFEMTPEGLKLEKDIPASPEIRRHTSHKLNWATLIVAVLAIGLLIADRMVPEAAVVEPQQTVDSGAATDPEAETRSTAQNEPNPASIAVLPFEDMSPDGDQQYFSSGIAEEILNVLVAVDGLEVASRTSAFRFQDRADVGIPGIARELDVRHVLEGSVRKAGDTIRITAQLIDGLSDKHLWSETYDRALTAENVFAIQDEIASAIVSALQETIALPTSSQATVSASTDNLDAYELYLEARGLFNARDRLDRAERLLAQAVELDPDFASAWAIRAAIYMLDSEYGDLGVPRDVAVDRVEEYAARTLSIDPDSALAIAVLAFNREIEARAGRANYKIAELVDDLTRAIEIDPKNASARNWLGITYGEIGHLDKALAQFQQCAADHPHYAPCVENAYDTLTSMGRVDEALEAYLAALESGAVTDEWVNLRLLAHFGMKAHFLFVTNQSHYLPGWRRHGEIWEAWNDLDADHDALVRDIRSYADRHLDLSDSASDLVNVLVPLGGSFDLLPFAILFWGPEYSKYRQSDAFRDRVVHLSVDEYWREHGFPPQCRPIVTADGDDDFECD